MATAEEQAAILAIAEGCRGAVIVELGARGGEDEPWIRAAFEREGPAHYVMVEPDMRNAQIILDVPQGTSRTRRLVLGAVASFTGMIIFHGSVSPDGSRTSGSIRRPTGHLLHLPDILFPESLRTTVPCYRLDDIVQNEFVEKIDLLWVDIQGAERDMIEGGREALKRTHYLFIEAETVELYEGEALKGELIAMLPGWTLLQDFGYNLLLRNDNPLLTGRLIAKAAGAQW
jgi:FkbM family methyltransferase